MFSQPRQIDAGFELLDMIRYNHDPKAFADFLALANRIPESAQGKRRLKPFKALLLCY